MRTATIGKKCRGGNSSPACQPDYLWNSPKQTTLKSLVGQQEGLGGAKVKVSSVYSPGPGLDGEGQVLGCGAARTSGENYADPTVFG